MAGRPRKPTNVRKLHGNPGNRALPKREPKPEPGIPEPPERIKANPIALAYWEERAAELDAMKVLTVADCAALAALVTAYCDWLTADEALETGLTQKRTTQGGDSYDAPRPEVAIRSDAWKRHKSMLVEFGLTPSARTRVAANPERKAGKLARFLESG